MISLRKIKNTAFWYICGINSKFFEGIEIFVSNIIYLLIKKIGETLYEI
tara:strand:- start:256 stop:402 length:147 start_codon:yes stop_codon:yes gene_type:complete